MALLAYYLLGKLFLLSLLLPTIFIACGKREMSKCDWREWERDNEEGREGQREGVSERRGSERERGRDGSE